MKYKVLEIEIRNGQYGEYKMARLEDENGIDYDKVMFTPRQSIYKDVVVGGSVECVLEPNDKGYLKAVVERKFKPNTRDYDGEERRRTARINWWASMNNSVQLLNSMATVEDWTDEEIQAFISRWGKWFLGKCHDYEVNIK